MSSSYPAALDNVAANKTNATREDLDHPTHHNKLADGLNAVQNTLGVNPQGSFASVASRFSRLDALNYKGTWNPTTNTPTLADGTGAASDAYIASATGSANLGSGSISFAVGDYVIYSGSVWQRIAGPVLSAAADETITGRWRFDGAIGLGTNPVDGVAFWGVGKYGLHFAHDQDYVPDEVPYDIIDTYNRSSGDNFYAVNWGGIEHGGSITGGMACFNGIIPYWHDAEGGGSVVNTYEGMVGLRLQALATNDDVQAVSIVHQGNGRAFSMDVQNPSLAQGSGDGMYITDWSDGQSLVLTKETVPANAAKGILDIDASPLGATEANAIVIFGNGSADKAHITTAGNARFNGSVQTGNDKVYIYNGGAGSGGILFNGGWELFDQGHARMNTALYIDEHIDIGKTSAPADGAIGASHLTLWLDDTNGAAKLMVKAKQADGTVRTGSLALS